MRMYPFIHGWIVHLYSIAPDSATSGPNLKLPLAGMFGLCAPLFAVTQKKLCGNAAGFFTTIVSPTRAHVTRSTNMQHGWSITTSAGFRFASPGWISFGTNAAFGFTASFGLSQTITFLTPRVFGLTITVSSRIGPFFRPAGPFGPATISGCRCGSAAFAGMTTCPLSVTHAAGGGFWAAATATASAQQTTHDKNRMGSPRPEGDGLVTGLVGRLTAPASR